MKIFNLIFWGLIFLSACHADTVGTSDFMGSKYLGAKYINDPLGEGIAPDTDPAIRFDAFDCTTFVETVLSNGNQDELNKIRYKNGKIDFLSRNHFIESDWLPNNRDILKNISGTFDGAAVRHVTIDKKSWFKTVHNIDTNTPIQTIDLDYVPYSALHNLDNNNTQIILFIVGKSKMHDKIGTDLAVVHMGFLMPGGKILRHASPRRGVVDDDFSQYIAKRRTMPNNIGIAIIEITK